jgi:outer membrane murein-binding lipoprotein Lpp
VRSRLVLLAAIVGLLLTPAGCWWDDEANRLRDEVATLGQEVAGLQATIDEAQDRHDRTAGAMERLRAILDDPGEFGTEEQVVAQLAQMSTEDAVLRDDVFGSTGVRSAWQDILFGWSRSAAMDTSMDVHHHWLAADGSQSGGLWVWHGTNCAGHRFQLVEVRIRDHDETGKATLIEIHYPYDDAYVRDAVEGAVLQDREMDARRCRRSGGHVLPPRGSP